MSAVFVIDLFDEKRFIVHWSDLYSHASDNANEKDRFFFLTRSRFIAKNLYSADSAWENVQMYCLQMKRSCHDKILSYIK